jgi:GNAT superfamily N-acetyltransferase
MLSLVLREATEDDRPYIASTYLKHFRTQHPQKFIPTKLYFRGQEPIKDYLLARARCVLAVFPEAPDEIVGFLLYEDVMEGFVLHYCYTRDQFRRRGIGRTLLDAVAGVNQLLLTTHATDHFVGLQWKAGRGRRIVYDPYLLGRLMHRNQEEKP